MTTFSLDRPFATWRARWALFLFWNGVGAAYLAQHYVAYLMGVARFPEGTVFWTMLGWYPWMLLTPLVFAAERRFPLGGRLGSALRARRVGLHAVMATVACVLEVGLVAGAHAIHVAVTDFEMDLWQYFRVALMRTYFVDLLFWFVLALSYAFVRHVVQKESELAGLESSLMSARLQSMRERLNPHVLFNTLHAIQSEMGARPVVARNMVTDLAALLRRSLNEKTPPRVALGAELDHLMHYVNIERHRFGDRLRVDMDVPEAVRHVEVPDLFLQPLVENAVRYGILPRADGGTVRIRAFFADGNEGNSNLLLVVEDDGPGIPGLPAAHTDGWPGDAVSLEHLPVAPGVGLTSTVERLEGLFPGASVTFATSRLGGLAVWARIPMAA
jgi:hypothetical protein